MTHEIGFENSLKWVRNYPNRISKSAVNTQNWLSKWASRSNLHPLVLTAIASASLSCIDVNSVSESLRTQMIAQFWYADAPGESHIAIRLDWQEGEPIASVEAPPHVADRLAELSIPHKQGSMRLPFALGYGVTIAGLTEAVLTITGDMTAWPQDWGALACRERGAKIIRIAQAH